MNIIRNNEDPTIRFAKLFGKIYYFMAKEMCNCLGKEEGIKAVRRAVRAFGEDRILSMKAEAAAKNVEVVDDDTFHLVRDMPGIGWEKVDGRVVHCPLAEMWEGYGDEALEFGALYCEVDELFFNAFGLELKRDHCLTTTKDFCEFNLSKMQK